MISINQIGEMNCKSIDDDGCVDGRASRQVSNRETVTLIWIWMRTTQSKQAVCTGDELDWQSGQLTGSQVGIVILIDTCCT